MDKIYLVRMREMTHIWKAGCEGGWGGVRDGTIEVANLVMVKV